MKLHKALIGFALFEISLLPLVADQKPPVFYFGGKQLYVGMSKSDAVLSLSSCCTLSPPAESDVEKLSVSAGRLLGHIIASKKESGHMLGTVYFRDGKVVKITRPLDDGVDTWDENTVGFVRAMNRALSPVVGDGESTVRVSVRHERLGNGNSDYLLLSFPNGRGVEIKVGTLDKPDEATNKRDFATIDETLDPVR